MSARSVGRGRAKLGDVARAAGVHPSTASRALNPATAAMISPAVTERVARAARRLGYRPSSIAASLRTARTRTIGIIVPDLANALFPPIIRGIEDRLGAGGYTAILANSDNVPQREVAILEKLRDRWIDGLILATARRDDPLVVECRVAGIPVVLINRMVDDPEVPAVVGDDVKGMAVVVAHLAGLGHKRIAHVAGPQTLSTGHLRHRGFLAAMEGRRLAVDPALIVVAENFRESEGRRACAALIAARRKFTAIVAANDLLAIGCYDALAEAGLRCPADVSVTGFNDMPLVDKLTPPLTTLRIPQYEMGRKAAEMLLGMLDGEDPTPTVARLPLELVVRGSTAAPRARGS